MANCTSIDNFVSQKNRPRKAGWQSVLADAVRDAGELCSLLGLDPTLAANARQPSEAFSLLVPRPYVARMRHGDPTDPLLLQVLPQAAEMLAAPGYQTDPLGEANAQSGPCLLRKYTGRILIVASGACAVHCRFCFRRHFRHGVEQFAPTIGWAEKIAAGRSIHEAILSGGDPLMQSDAALADLIESLAAIPHLRRVRLHTRLPVMIPERVTDELAAILRATRLTPIVVVHVNHPAEIDNAVALAFARLIDAGVPVLSQSVLLRGVNDSVETLAKLFQRLVDCRVMPYYLHQLDHVAGAAHFEAPISLGVAMMTELRARLPGYAVPRYVRETPGGTNKEVLV